MRTYFLTIAVAFAITNPILLFADELPPPVDRQVDFARDVQPILSKHCWSCHGIEKQEAGLRLDRSDLAMLGGDSGKAIQPGVSAQSRLIHYVAGTDSEKSCRRKARDCPATKLAYCDLGSIKARYGPMTNPRTQHKRATGPINH